MTSPNHTRTGRRTALTRRRLLLATAAAAAFGAAGRTRAERLARQAPARLGRVRDQILAAGADARALASGLTALSRRPGVDTGRATLIARSLLDAAAELDRLAGRLSEPQLGSKDRERLAARLRRVAATLEKERGAFARVREPRCSQATSASR